MTAASTPAPVHVPGETGIWVFIGGDLVLFSVFFYLFLDYRAAQTTQFAEAQRHLNQGLGLFNTLLMLTSSWLVAGAVQAARERKRQAVSLCLKLAIACGACFVVVKYFEYSEKIAAGLTLSSGDFFMFYYCYTGIHLIHVLIGTSVLTALALKARRADYAGTDLRNLESGASFWHLIDLLWIVLFALLYLVGHT